MDLQTYLKERTALVDQALEQYLPAEDKCPQSIHKAMRYSILPAASGCAPS